jgi:hypothetical protein
MSSGCAHVQLDTGFSRTRAGLSGAICHYRKQKLCRAPEPLPRVKKRALGKACLCLEHHSVKQKTRQTALCRVPGTRHRKALGNDNFAESWALGIPRHSAKHSYVVQAVIFAESPTRDARRRYNFAESGP